MHVAASPRPVPPHVAAQPTLAWGPRLAQAFATGLLFFGAIPTPAQRTACVGSLFLPVAIEDARQSPIAALGWRLPAGHDVRAFAQVDDALRAWRPDVVILQDGVCKPDALDDLTARLRSDAAAPRTFLAALSRRDTSDADLAATRALASRHAIPFVDLRAALREGTMAGDDALNPFGADAVAGILAQALTGQLPASTTTPVPSPEYRASAAGWGTGSWWDQHDKIRALAAANRDLALVFVGDSITQSLTGTGNRLTAPDGGRAIDQTFGHVKAAGFGIAGDRTQHVLFRLRQGELAALRPRAIVLQIGINNVSAGDSAPAIAAGIEAIVAELRGAQPQAQVVVCGPFPAGADGKAPARRVVAAIHDLLRQRPPDERVTHLDLSALFVSADGTPNDRLAPDHLHITEAGREAWLAAIAHELRNVVR